MIFELYIKRAALLHDELKNTVCVEKRNGILKLINKNLNEAHKVSSAHRCANTDLNVRDWGDT